MKCQITGCDLEATVLDYGLCSFHWTEYNEGKFHIIKPDQFEVKDSGARHQFDSGMVRDVEDGKIDFTNVLHGPMLVRWAAHLTKAKAKYPDVRPGVPNWTLAEGVEELHRYRRSALRHMLQWLNGETDEDHAAAVFFNINGAEDVAGRMVDDALSARGPDRPRPRLVGHSDDQHRNV
jgi:hypothetical protein